VQIMADVINGESRYRLPVVYVSKCEGDKDSVDISRMAGRLKGIAHVFSDESTEINEKLAITLTMKTTNITAPSVSTIPSLPWNINDICTVKEKDTTVSSWKRRSIPVAITNTQVVEPLFTWEGVRNASLLDTLTSKQEELQRAEKGRKKAEEQAAKLTDTMDEEAARMQKEANERSRREYEELLAEFDEEMQEQKKKIAELSDTINRLQSENQGLKAKLDSMSGVPVLVSGEEYEIYPGEIKDLVLTLLSEILKETDEDTRRHDILEDLIENNRIQTYQRAECFRNQSTFQ